MLNLFVNRSRPILSQMLSRTLIVGALSAVGIISGWVPSLTTASSPTLTFGTSAYAQNDGEVQKFARIIMEFESKRRQIVGQIANIIGSKDVPAIGCNSSNQPQISGSLPRNALPLAQQLCNEYSNTIKKYGMPRDRFEEIARAVNGNPPANPDLKRRVDQALINLQD